MELLQKAIENKDVRLTAAFNDFLYLFASEDRLDPESKTNDRERQGIILEHAKTASAKHYVSLEDLLEKLSAPAFVLRNAMEQKNG